jgi:hypothetical protein
MKPGAVEVAAAAGAPNPTKAAVEAAGAPKPVMIMTKKKMRYGQKKQYIICIHSSEIITTKTEKTVLIMRDNRINNLQFPNLFVEYQETSFSHKATR